MDLLALEVVVRESAVVPLGGERRLGLRVGDSVVDGPVVLDENPLLRAQRTFHLVHRQAGVSLERIALADGVAVGREVRVTAHLDRREVPGLADLHGRAVEDDGAGEAVRSLGVRDAGLDQVEVVPQALGPDRDRQRVGPQRPERFVGLRSAGDRRELEDAVDPLVGLEILRGLMLSPGHPGVEDPVPASQVLLREIGPGGRRVFVRRDEPSDDPAHRAHVLLGRHLRAGPLGHRLAGDGLHVRGAERNAAPGCQDEPGGDDDGQGKADACVHDES